MDISKFTKTVGETAAAEDVSTLDLLDSMLDLENVRIELASMVASYDTVMEIKESIAGREIGDAFIAYAGESLAPFAPAFVEGNSEEAVAQMEEGLKEAGAKVKKMLTTLVEKIRAFFKKIFAFFSKKKKGKGGSSSDSGSAIEHINDLVEKVNKAKSSKLEWDKPEEVIDLKYIDSKAIRDIRKVLDKSFKIANKAVRMLGNKQYDDVSNLKVPETLVAAEATSANMTPNVYLAQCSKILANADIIKDIKETDGILAQLKVGDDTPNDAAVKVSKITGVMSSNARLYVSMLLCLEKALKKAKVAE